MMLWFLESPFTNIYHNDVELIYRHFPNKKALNLHGIL